MQIELLEITEITEHFIIIFGTLFGSRNTS